MTVHDSQNRVVTRGLSNYFSDEIVASMGIMDLLFAPKSEAAPYKAHFYSCIKVCNPGTTTNHRVRNVVLIFFAHFLAFFAHFSSSAFFVYVPHYFALFTHFGVSEHPANPFFFTPSVLPTKNPKPPPVLGNITHVVVLGRLRLFCDVCPKFAASLF